MLPKGNKAKTSSFQLLPACMSYEAKENEAAHSSKPFQLQSRANRRVN